MELKRNTNNIIEDVQYSVNNQNKDVKSNIHNTKSNHTNWLKVTIIGHKYRLNPIHEVIYKTLLSTLMMVMIAIIFIMLAEAGY